MAGQAKFLNADEQRRVMAFLAAERAETFARDRVAMLLSWRAGLRVCEIARLELGDVTDASGRLGDAVRVRRLTTKGKTFTRYVPMHAELREALLDWLKARPARNPSLLGVSVNALTVWFYRMYARCGLDGCSSHSGRRTFITKLARNCTTAGASLEDVRRLAGHAFLTTTQGYIAPSDDARGRLIALAG